MNILRMALWVGLMMGAWWLYGGGQTHTVGHSEILLGVLACFSSILVLGWKGRSGMVAIRGGGRARIFRTIAWLGMVAIGLFWLGTATHSLVREMVSAWENSLDSTSATDPAAEPGLQETTGHMDWDEGSRRALPRKTNIKLGKKPEAFLRIDDRAQAVRMAKGPIYLASVAYDAYSDSAWHIATAAPREMRADDSGRILLGPAERSDGIWHTIVIPADARRRIPLVALQGVSQVEGLRSIERWSQGLYLLPELDAPQNGYRYRAHSLPMALRDATGGEHRALDPGHHVEWLRLPEDAVGKQIANLAKSVAAEGALVDKARRIQSHLRENYRYSLATDNPKNLDPLENFLFGEKSGHCEYFATAGALMARSVGIPSRVMYGWAGGIWYEHADWFVFRADEAHVWVEVWLGEHGWVVLDPTPPEALRSQARATRHEQLPPMPGAVEVDNQEDPADRPRSAAPWIASILLSVAGLLILLRPSRQAPTVEDRRIIPEPWRDRAALHYMEEWRKAVRKSPSRRPTGSSTLRQQLKSVNPQPEFAADLLGYHYRVRYEGHPRDRTQERRLMRRIRAWSAEFRE